MLRLSLGVGPIGDVKTEEGRNRLHFADVRNRRQVSVTGFTVAKDGLPLVGFGRAGLGKPQRNVISSRIDGYAALDDRQRQTFGLEITVIRANQRCQMSP